MATPTPPAHTHTHNFHKITGQKTNLLCMLFFPWVLCNRGPGHAAGLWNRDPETSCGTTVRKMRFSLKQRTKWKKEIHNMIQRDSQIKWYALQLIKTVVMDGLKLLPQPDRFFCWNLPVSSSALRSSFWLNQHFYWYFCLRVSNQHLHLLIIFTFVYNFLNVYSPRQSLI